MEDYRLESEMVSIIVPIYNMQKYLKTCIQSLVKQTFNNIEILLIDDGSTDLSLQICNQFKQNDERIRVFHKQNGGLGSTRNFGIKHATGKYVLFIDADDWLREDSIQLLYDKAERESADVVHFDLVEYIQDENKYIRCYENQKYLNCETFIKTKLQNCTLPSSCTSMYLLSKWCDKELMFPTTLFEDNAVYPLILLEFEKHVILPEGLYFYRRNHEITITNNYENYLLRCQPLEYLIKETKKRGYFDSYKKDIMQFCYNQLKESLYHIKFNLNDDSYIKALNRFNTFLKSYFGCSDRFYDRNFLYMGSYNVGRIGNNISSQNINECRFNFFSLISLMTDKHEEYSLKCGNEYKELMFRKEYNKDVLHILKEKPYKYLVFDLLEERYPLIKTAKGSYYTGTEALVKYLEIENIEGYSVIMNGSLEYDKLWKQCCLKFINFCKDNFDTAHLIMVRNILADTYGNEEERVDYKNKQQTKEINKKLLEYYDFFVIQCPKMITITPEKEDYYTDINFKYGCIPEHLNNQLYKKLADSIINEIEINRKITSII